MVCCVCVSCLILIVLSPCVFSWLTSCFWFSCLFFCPLILSPVSRPWLLALPFLCLFVWRCIPLSMSDRCVFLWFAHGSCVGGMRSCFIFLLSLHHVLFSCFPVWLACLFLVKFPIFAVIYFLFVCLFCSLSLSLSLPISLSLSDTWFLVSLSFIIVFLLWLYSRSRLLAPPPQSALQSWESAFHTYTENGILIWLISEFCCSCAF